MRTKKEYPESFKKEALHLLETSGKPMSEIERDLGMTPGLLSKWKKRFQVNPVNDELELSEVEQLKAELRQAKRELEITRMERDILKKTVGIFSKDQRP